MSAWWLRNRQRIIQLVGTVLAITLLIFLLREDGWDEIVSAMQKIKLIDLFWVAILFSVSRIAVVWRWHVLLRSGGINIRFKDSAALTFMGLFASNFLPTTIGGDIVRLGGAMQMGFDRAVCLASIAADRLIGMFGMAMTTPIGLVQAWGILKTGTTALTFLAFTQKSMDFIKRTFSIFSIWFKKPIPMLLALGFSWVHMLCLFGSIYIFIASLGNHVSFWMIAGLWSLTYFITLIPISINGYGLQELSFTFLMSHLAGLTPAISLTVAVLLRAYFLLSSLPGAAFLPSILASMTAQRTQTSIPSGKFSK